VILTRDEALAYLSSATIAPITSAIRGAPSEVLLDQEDGMKAPCAVNLHNIVTVSQSRLGKRVGRLSAHRIKQICAAMAFSVGCDLS
jgi:mRNA interferase MazF